MLDYPAVVKRLDKWGLLPTLQLAHTTRLPAESAYIYARAILGGRTPIRIKRTYRSWAYPHNESITLACDKARTVRLRDVLHECAHILDYRKGRKLGHSSHGEAFCRTYARLLRDVIL